MGKASQSVTAMAGLMVQRMNRGWGLRVGDLYTVYIYSYPELQQNPILAYHCGHRGDFTGVQGI